MKYTAYHGSDVKFDAFKNVDAGHSYAPDMYFFSDSKAHALEYTFRPKNDRQYLYECDVTMERPLVVECKNAKWTNIPQESLPKEIRQIMAEEGYRANDKIVANTVVSLIQNHNLPYDGVVFNNINDNLDAMCLEYYPPLGHQYEKILQQYPEFADRTLKNNITANSGADFFKEPTTSYVVMDPSQVQIDKCIDISALPLQPSKRDQLTASMDNVRKSIRRDRLADINASLASKHIQIMQSQEGNFYLIDNKAGAIIMSNPSLDSLAASVMVQAEKALPSHFKVQLSPDEQKKAERFLDAAEGMSSWYEQSVSLKEKEETLPAQDPNKRLDEFVKEADRQLEGHASLDDAFAYVNDSTRFETKQALYRIGKEVGARDKDLADQLMNYRKCGYSDRALMQYDLQMVQQKYPDIDTADAQRWLDFEDEIQCLNPTGKGINDGRRYLDYVKGNAIEIADRAQQVLDVPKPVAVDVSVPEKAHAKTVKKDEIER